MDNALRTQIAIICGSPTFRQDLNKLSRWLTNDRFMSRMPDFPSEVDGSSIFDTVTRLLLMANGRAPFALVAVTGNEKQIADSAKLFLAVRKRTVSSLIMCPKGYEHLKVVADIPCLVTGYPPQTYDVRMTILLGEMREFPDYDNSMFGKATCLPLRSWDAENMRLLAQRLHEAARSRSFAC